MVRTQHGCPETSQGQRCPGVGGSDNMPYSELTYSISPNNSTFTQKLSCFSHLGQN